MRKTTVYQSIYLLPIILGLGIIFGVSAMYLLISDYQGQLSQSYKHQINGVLTGVVDRRESRLQTIGNSMIGFFESRDINFALPDLTDYLASDMLLASLNIRKHSFGG